MMESNASQNGQGATSEPFDNMETLLESKGLNIDFPQQGEIRQGVIASITPDQILVNVGTKSEGIISGKELEAISKSERDSQRESGPFLHTSTGRRKLEASGTIA